MPATIGSGNWYNWIHWQKTPSSESLALAMRKNSGVYRVATPATHGFDGSETITS